MSAADRGRLAQVLATRGGQAPPEAPLVIEHREALIYMLCEAAELEHGIMCQYLFAAFSLKQSTDEGLSESELQAVARWRGAVAHVATEEMLHLALVHNLLSSIGAAPHFARPNLPAPAHHYPAGVNLALVPFGEPALRHFMFLERPEGMQLHGAEGLDAALAEATPLMDEGDIVPRLQDFATVGHLYRSIEHGFARLAEKYGEAALFVGPPGAQATSDAFGWPELIPVTDLASAQTAIDTILEQGEGARGHWEDAHFGQFVRVLEEYRELKHANPAFEPARPVLPAKVRPGERDHDTPLIDDPLSARCVDLFNVGYEVLLQTLERFFAHTEETDAELATLAEVTIALMVRVLKPLGSLITTLPVGPGHPGRTAGPSFELFYETDYLMPHREAAWALLEERLRESADFCTRTAGDCGPDLAARLEPVQRAITEIADMLGAHREPSDGGAPAPAALATKKVEALLTRAAELTGERWAADAPGLGDTVWTRAQELTERLAAAPGDLALAETAACLQQLATLLCQPDEVEARVARLRELQSGLGPGIRVARDGPYLLTGPARLRNWLGEPVDATPQTALCRCGASTIKPFCDGSHERVGFSGAKSPDRVPDQRDSYEGVQLTVYDNRGICQHSGFCTDRLNTVFRTDQEPFVAASGGRMDEIIRAVRDCPSGALSYAIDGVEARAEVDHHGQRAPAIEVSRDGPYRVTGALALLDHDGQDVERAQGASREHFALCRCGQSQNKPFCSGMHWYVDFHDPVPDPDHAPSVFEWAGGLPALRRMTRRFYETHVPADPLLAPLFAGMAADHPERVASWLAEVFGGPRRYSERYGGYERMLSQHLGRGLSEEQRARWVELLMRSAREAGLPDDAEFSAAFRSYIEWGSHLAVENSAPGARPPEHMPMPHWDWSTAAGPPGSRPDPSAEKPAAAEPTLPGADEPVSFERHIKTLFRAGDRRSMQFAFDLWSYEDVRTHAEAILAQVQAGTMPCDGAWAPEWVAALARWVESGMAA